MSSVNRQVILDTETTGLNARTGDRIIEIGCVELINRQLTGQSFHRYVNPQRAVEAGALKVHGITDEFLADKPLFVAIADEFLDYIRGAELVIHNAAFDVEFLDEELRRLNRGLLNDYVGSVHDTLRQARELHPGRKNSLDALCERYQIDNRQRTLHGALLDATLLAEVYLSMTRGQDSLAIELERSDRGGPARGPVSSRGPLRIINPTEQELTDHHAVLASIAKESANRCVWIAPAAETARDGAD